MTSTEKITEPSTKITAITPTHGNSGNRNALVHGIYSSEIVLSFESAEDFEQLHSDLKEEWSPRGRQEEETVLALARWNWIKYRLMRAQRMSFRKDPFVADLEKSGAKTWSEVENFVEQKATKEIDIMSEMKNTLKGLQDVSESASSLMRATVATANHADSVEIFRQVQGLEDMFCKFNNLGYEKVREKIPSTGRNLPNPIVDQAYHPEYLEKLIRLEASVDTRIDKLLQRLVSLKEYKRLARESTKTIAPPEKGSTIET
jgi:hypothetical protein